MNVRRIFCTKRQWKSEDLFDFSLFLDIRFNSQQGVPISCHVKIFIDLLMWKIRSVNKQILRELSFLRTKTGVLILKIW